MSVEQGEWEKAVRHLFEDAFPYDATGPRRHEDWVLDVIDLMARAVPDPRGWAGLDAATYFPESKLYPTFPFVPHPPEYLAKRLHEIDRAGAEGLLLGLTDEGCTVVNLRRFTESEEELREMARTILARYGDGARFYTNVRKPSNLTGTVDISAPDSFSYSPFSQYTEDYGLIVVTDNEVGMFWNFADY
ncbi:hypothetical protein ABT160_41030 [Streptomyces sp. NPDC001941]|uniref:hypothetical protein n=1 Tax=Streptomyces sp. NPDC001941 TaxID=3154659 RepID=UPI0033187150